MGLSRVRHQSEKYIDLKSRPKDNMPDWWISSNWIDLPESDEDEDEDNDENDDNNNNNGLNNQNDGNNRDKDGGNNNAVNDEANIITS